MVLRILFYAFLIYLAWKLVFNLIIPMVRTTRQIRKGFKEMQQKMQDHAGQYHNQQQNSHQPTSAQKPEKGDYIEFEEIR